MLQDGELLSQGKVLDGGSSAAYNECPEEQENALKDTHAMVHQMPLGLWKPEVIGFGGRGALSSGPHRLELLVHVVLQVA